MWFKCIYDLQGEIIFRTMPIHKLNTIQSLYVTCIKNVVGPDIPVQKFFY